MTHAKPHLFAVAMAATLLVGTIIGGEPAFSNPKYPPALLLRASHDSSIVQALTLLSDGGDIEAVNRIVHKPMRVIFKDMTTLHKSLKNYDALSWISGQGEQVLFINQKHRGAPPEALAALISHESMHADEFNSLTEEVTSWQHEAKVWMALKQAHPELEQISAGEDALVDRENRIEQEYRQGTLEAFVRSSPGYQGLPATSPGFSTKTAETPVEETGIAQ